MNPTSLGQGISWPPRIDGDGRLLRSADADNVREAIQVILLTEPGERVRLPEFGAGLGRFLFEPNIPATHIAIARAIDLSLKRWEPRIRVAQVEVDADPTDSQAALATIAYRLVSNAQQATLNISVPVAS
ncbi:MAG: GPW/gp25 family protein [Propionivibrio sp.]|uniref:GPW/gp25 family protein n=1 Tax=Propionivibrio sp. TaxID=2212460 RepID=UPI001B600E0C|nr:GPW/gp25 family protein [Propionivibrio sp.]MBP7204843.1 GPW/gp25 family protein [Propionivibrio sp.]